MLHMILTDFDGTLFSKGENKLSDDFVTKIRRLTDCGMIFAVNSGRPYHSLREMIRPLESRTVFICNDGAQIMYKNCLLQKTTVNREQIIPLVQFAVNEGIAPFAALRERTLPVTEDILANKGLFGEDIYKLVFVKNKVCDDVVEKMKKSAQKFDLRCCYEDGMYIEFCHINANKGNATAYIKNRFRIKDGVAAFGDGDNDISMFEQADIVYVMKSAEDICYSGATVIESMQDFVVKEM